MIATIIYIVCMLWIPKTFKNAGIQYVVQNKLQGVWFILLSKTLWWMALLNLLIFWFPQGQTYFTLVCIVGLTYSMYKDKKYIIFEFKEYVRST